MKGLVEKSGREIRKGGRRAWSRTAGVSSDLPCDLGCTGERLEAGSEFQREVDSNNCVMISIVNFHLIVFEFI